MQTQSTEALVFTYLVKQRFWNQAEKFDKYCKILRDLCSKRGEDPRYGFSELKKMFANHQDLLIGLHNFLPENHQTANKIPILNFHSRNNNSLLKRTIEFVNKIHSRFADNNNNNNNNNENNVFIEFCDIMSKYQNKQVKIDEVHSLLTDLFQKDPDLYVDFTGFTVVDEEFEEDTEDGNFVFTASGNKRRRRRTGRKDLSEETLEIWETYKYELDMKYLRIKSTAKKLEGKPVKIEELRFQDFKCIEVLYGEEDGEAVVQQLLSKPDRNAPTIKSRMEKKVKEIQEWKILTDMIWGEILEDIRERREQVRHSCFLEKLRRVWRTRMIDFQIN